MRLQIDLARGAEPVLLAVHRPEGRVLLASGGARGFVAPEQAIAAQTRAGKQVFNLDEGERVVVACPADGDHVATIGTNRKMLIFPLDQLPVMSRGKGVLLQRYRDGRLVRCPRVRARRRPELAEREGRAHHHRARALARPARPGRPHGAARLPEKQSVRRLRLAAGSIAQF